MDKTYKGNPNLKAISVDVSYTEEHVTEFLKCSKDPQYFIEEYVNIIYYKYKYSHCIFYCFT